MRIAVLSDIHLGLTRPACVIDTLHRLEDEHIGLIVLAGDLGEPFVNFEDCLDLFSGYEGQVAVLAGNHDVWARSDISSRRLWEELLPEAVLSRGYVWLEEQKIVCDDVAILGSIGWYDYSARPPGFEAKSNEDCFITKIAYNNDARYINWPWTDIEFSRLVGDALVERLQTVQERDDLRHVVIVTHVPIFEAQRVPSSTWRHAGDIYYGNWTLGRRVEEFDKVRAVVSGHTHKGMTTFHQCPDFRPIQVAVVDSDYDKPGYLVLDTDLFAKRASPGAVAATGVV